MNGQPQAFQPSSELSAFAIPNPYAIGQTQVGATDVATPDWTTMSANLRSQFAAGTEPIMPSIAARPDTAAGMAGQASAAAATGDPVADARAREDAAMEKAGQMEVGALTEAANKEKALAETTGTRLQAQTSDAISTINEQTAVLERRSAEREKTDRQIEATQLAKADALKSYEARLDQWAQSTPTKQASYATAMHMAAPLSMLAALGGAMTRASGLQMLGALNGVIEGVNSGAENQYQDAMTKWNAAYKSMMDKEAMQEKVYNTMLEAYQGRADAQDKAIQRTRDITNDRLQANQLQMGTDTQIFNMKKGVIDAIAQRNIAMAKVQEARAARMARAQGEMAMDQDAIHVAALEYLKGAKLTDIAPASRGGGYKAAIVSEATKLFEQQHAGDEKYQGAGGKERMLADVADLETRARMELTGEAQRLRSANVMLARVEWAENEITRLAPLAKAINHRVMGRVGFLPFNELWERGLTTIQDKDMAQFASVTNTIMNAYNVLSARGGTDLNVRERNLSMLSTTSDPEVYDSKLDMMIQEINAAKQAGLDTTAMRSRYMPQLEGEDAIQSRGYNKDLPAPWIPLQSDPTATAAFGGGGGSSEGWTVVRE